MDAIEAPDLTLPAIASVTGGTLEGASSAGPAPAGYSIDSRTVKPGELFFAIRGPNQDGHRFLADAAAKGARALVVSRREALQEAGAAVRALPVIVVPDTLTALQGLASHVRHSLPIKVVGITGSSGKTTTKEMTRQALEAVFRVHASRGNLNNLYGCPLSLLELAPQHQVSVLELGMSYAGELTRLAQIADPDIGVLTNVSGAHLEHFASLDDVAAAKEELFAGMRDNTTGIFNADDDRVRRIAERFRGFVFTFGIERPADLTASDYRLDGLEGGSFEVQLAHNGAARRVRVRTRFAGVHHVYNALAAMSCGYMLGIDLEAMAARLSELVPLGMRGRVLKLKGPVRLLDDCYNSNPAAMLSALQVLAHADPPGPSGRRVLVMGDMLELGETSVAAHRDVGRAAAAASTDLFFAVGKLAGEALEAAGSVEGRSFATSEEAARAVADAIRPGDLVLVKGSRGTALEKVVAAVRERFGEE